MADFAPEPIDPALARKLDAFTVPALPEGFAARVAAAAQALPIDDSVPPSLPRQRRTTPRRWLRSGAAGFGVIAAGMLSISAAAMGYFGEPVRQAVDRAPVIGKVIERVIPERLRHRAPQVVHEPKAPARAGPPAVASEPAQALAMPLAPGLRRGRFASPEERRAWIEAHPEQAARIIERRRAWAEAHPVRAARIAQRRRAWMEAHPEQAAQIAERRRAWAAQNPEAAARIANRRAELQRQRSEAGEQPVIGPQAGPMGLQPGARRQWRLERRERMRQWREGR